MGASQSSFEDSDSFEVAPVSEKKEFVSGFITVEEDLRRRGKAYTTPRKIEPEPITLGSDSERLTAESENMPMPTILPPFD